MNKILGIILPYIMIACVAIIKVSDILQKNMIEALIVGIFLAFWFLCISKSEGTVLMKLGIILSIIIEGVAMIVGIVTHHILLLTDFIPLLLLLICVECMGYYMVSQNKPRLSMTYKYSYKNRRRRYF